MYIYHEKEAKPQDSHHVVSRQQPLQELGLFVLHGFNDELVVAGQVEERAAGARVGQLDQGLVYEGILMERDAQTKSVSCFTCNTR